VISKEDWIGRRLVADRFPRPPRLHLRRRRPPVGAVRRLRHECRHRRRDEPVVAPASHLAGWADPAILDAYEIERLPITDQVSRFAMDHAQQMIKARGAVPARIEEPGPEGDAIRADFGRRSYELNVQQFCCAGLNFGYFYDRSPLIAYDGETAPVYSMGGFTPSTVPGCRAPHFRLADGRSLHDACGPDYTLLRFEQPSMRRRCSPRRAPARSARAARRAAAYAPAEYRHALVLVRADQHVGWRGDTVPDDPTAWVERLRGAVPMPVARSLA
jgi:hypothetical protein